MKTKIIISCVIFISLLTGCAGNQGSVSNQAATSSSVPASGVPASSAPAGITPAGNAPMSTDSTGSAPSGGTPVGKPADYIPANASVNTAWDGGMCAAGGYIYYVTAAGSDIGSPMAITRMNQDGSNSAVISAEYANISRMTADDGHIYFVVTSPSRGTETLFSLPLDGGEAKKVTEGNIRVPQCAQGKLFWENFSPLYTQPAPLQIKCANPDGSNEKTLRSLSTSVLGPFIVTEDAIYYTVTMEGSDYSDYSDIYRMDLSGAHNVKLNKKRLNSVDILFYDQGQIYFLMRNDFQTDPFTESVNTIDQNGKLTTVMKDVYYFPQDFGCIEYCGISNGVIYYFVPASNSGSSNHLPMDLHQYDISGRLDSVLLKNVEMGDSAVSLINSLRGRSLTGAVNGMYILGNDIYWSPFLMP